MPAKDDRTGKATRAARRAPDSAAKRWRMKGTDRRCFGFCMVQSFPLLEVMEASVLEMAAHVFEAPAIRPSTLSSYGVIIPDANCSHSVARPRCDLGGSYLGMLILAGMLSKFTSSVNATDVFEILKFYRLHTQRL